MRLMYQVVFCLAVLLVSTSLQAQDVAEPKIGDRRVFDGVVKELYRIRIENGRRFLHYRPLQSIVSRVVDRPITSNCPGGICPLPTKR